MKIEITRSSDAKGRAKLMDRILSLAELILLLIIGLSMLSFLPA